MTSVQKEKTAQFMSFTGSDEKTATTFLKGAGWKLDQACDAYFQQQSATPTFATATSTSLPHKRVDQAKLTKLFESYKDADENFIGLEGTERLCQDLEVDPMDIVTLILAFHLKCERMCEFKLAGWLEGWSNLQLSDPPSVGIRKFILTVGNNRCETLEDMKKAIPVIRGDLDDPIKFKDIYLFTFNFARQENQKGLGETGFVHHFCNMSNIEFGTDCRLTVNLLFVYCIKFCACVLEALETATAFWQLLFTGRYEHIDLWLEFLEDHKNSISKDTWVQFHDFTKKYPSSFEGYEEDGAWPLLIDEFVEFAQEKLE
ncbi:DCN1-like protein 1 [Chytriomyces hyalinus]|nr:DCN1-like protein 1 [Chytriomyces hyalinus]